MVFIRTENLLLRPGWVDDAPALTEAFAREDVVMTLATAPWPYSVDDAVAYLGRDRSAHEADLLVFLRTPGAPRNQLGIGVEQPHDARAHGAEPGKRDPQRCAHVFNPISRSRSCR